MVNLLKANKLLTALLFGMLFNNKNVIGESQSPIHLAK